MNIIEKLESEKTELDEKIKKLGRFLKKPTHKVTARQFDLIRMQKGIMSQYSKILDKRIEDLKDTESDEA